MSQQLKNVKRLLSWSPPWCRPCDGSIPPCTTWLVVLYAYAGGFTSANLYYSHPILHALADDFAATQSQIANIPTLALAGDATGILFILPLADFFPRRKFILALIICAEILWIPLCITKNLQTFEIFSYLAALFGGTTQIMLPLVAETSSDEKRAFNIAIVATGPTLGILLARILSGVVANYTSWRNVYWLALGLQGSVLVALWLLMPTYPTTNDIGKRKLVKTYPRILWTIITLFPKHPILVQSSLLSFSTFVAVSSFWTTLTFLLSGSPYHYSTVDIGLFGLIGLSTMVLGPIYGKFIIKPLRQPLLSVIVGKTVSLAGVLIGTYTGQFTIAEPVIQALFLDAGLMIVQISNRLAIHPVYPEGRNRVNTAFVSVMYLGSLTGTKVGNSVYAKAGGWWASGTCSVGILALSYFLIILRGPHEEGWIGWSGGWRRGSLPQDSPQKTLQSDPESGIRLSNVEADTVSVEERSDYQAKTIDGDAIVSQSCQ